MIELVIAQTDAERLVQELLRGSTELCAVLFALRAQRSDGTIRLLVRETVIPDDESYTRREMLAAELSPAFVAQVSKRAHRTGESLVFVHSHPGANPPEFSAVDDAGEARLAGFLANRAPGASHAAAVVSKGGWRARELGTTDPLSLIALGTRREVLFEARHGLNTVEHTFDRQVRAFGEAGQRILNSLTVAVVGLGGTGSIVAEQLAYLGVRRFILIDPDQIEGTNLNRVVGATASDLGRPKVDAAASHLNRIAPASSIKTVLGDVTRTGVARSVTTADFIFCCTDSHGSRAVVQQLAYQYFIPAVDLGVILTASGGELTGIHGRIQALAPGLPCLTCSGLIDAEEVRRDMMDEAERRADPYIQGAREPAPAVISINGTISSLAITMFMAMTVGVPSTGRYVLYDARRPSLRVVAAAANPSCFICSRSGALGRADTQGLYTRDA
jgi:molybdopterin/thiamine biosynthesis adenylyltransferase/proteasome lid subunit RPN8/RPN11